MLYSKREYSLSARPVDEQIVTKAQEFLTDNEAVLHTFDNDEVIAFFTSKKIIFICSNIEHICEIEILPYQSISRCLVIGSPNTEHGKLEIVVSDEIIISFYMPKYDTAKDLCRAILQ